MHAIHSSNRRFLVDVGQFGLENRLGSPAAFLDALHGNRDEGVLCPPLAFQRSGLGTRALHHNPPVLVLGYGTRHSTIWHLNSSHKGDLLLIFMYTKWQVVQNFGNRTRQGKGAGGKSVEVSEENFGLEKVRVRGSPFALLDSCHPRPATILFRSLIVTSIPSMADVGLRPTLAP